MSQYRSDEYHSTQSIDHITDFWDKRTPSYIQQQNSPVYILRAVNLNIYLSLSRNAIEILLTTTSYGKDYTLKLTPMSSIWTGSNVNLINLIDFFLDNFSNYWCRIHQIASFFTGDIILCLWVIFSYPKISNEFNLKNGPFRSNAWECQPDICALH